MTYLRARAIYQIRQYCLDILEKLEAAGLSDHRKIFEGHIIGCDSHLEETVEKMSIANPHRIPTDALAVITIAAREEETFGNLLIGCGLSMVRSWTPREAHSKLNKAMRSAVLAGNPEDVITDDVIALLEDASGLSLRSAERTRDAIEAALCRKRGDHFLSGVTVRIGKHLAEADTPYRLAYQKELTNLESQNEDGGFAKIAVSHASKPGISREDLHFYEVGRIPRSHLESMARRNVTVSLFEELWDKTHATAASR